MPDVKELTVKQTLSIRDAVKQLDAAGIGFLICVDDRTRVMGVLTDGDFRRAVLRGQSLEDAISKIMNRDFLSLPDGFSVAEAQKIFSEKPVRHLPVVDNNGLLLRMVSKDVMDGTVTLDIAPEKQLRAPVVIMAGGKGTRLEPFTKILPKPLVPIGEKPIIELIMDAFSRFGMEHFYISVNHKQRMIKAYFEDHPAGFSIDYIVEDKPLGTAGALKFLQGKIDQPFFVSNCDILIQDDYSAIYNFHRSGEYDLTIVAAMHHHTVPYGVCQIMPGGQLKTLIEKPTQDVLVNTGFYLLQPDVLEKIPADTFYHITDLIADIRSSGGTIGVFPVSEGAWIDIGQWEEYRKSVERMKL